MITLSGRAVDHDGGGLQNAAVTFEAEVYENEARRGTVIRSLASTTSGEDGSFLLDLPADRILSDAFYSGYVLIEHSDGLGWQRVDQLRTARHAGGLETLSADDLNLTVRVNPAHQLAVRVVTPTGEAIPNVIFKPHTLYSNEFSDYRNLRLRNFYVPGVTLPDRLQRVIEGRSRGEYLLQRVPQSGTLLAKVGGVVSAGRLLLALPCDEPTTVSLDARGEIRGTLVCADSEFDPSQVSIEIRLVETGEALPGRDNYLFGFFSNDSPKSGRDFQLSGLPIGSYSVKASLENDHGYYALPTPNQMVSLQSRLSEVQIEFKKSLRLRGRVLDAGGREGVVGVTVGLNWSDPDTRAWQSFGQVETDQQGYFEGYARPGRMSAYLGVLPKTHRALSGGRQSVEVEPGDTVTTLADLVVTRGAVLSGSVVNAAGEPQPYAEIWVLAASSSGGGPPNYLKADGQGRFHLEQLDPEDTLPLRALAGDAVTAGAIIVDAAEGTESVQLAVSPEHAFYIEGEIVSHDGKPVVGAEVRLQWNRSYVSRKSPGSGIGSTYQTLKSGDDGTFRTRPLWAGDRYRIRVTADGYRTFESFEVTGTAGAAHDFGKLRLMGTAGIVSGRIVDASGGPIADATVFNRGDGPSESSTKTAADGRFTLAGLTEGTVFVLARKEGMWLGGRAINAPADNIELVLHGRNSSHAAGTLAPFTYSERRALAEELLRELYALPVEQRREINFLILRHMARANPAVAMAWLDDPGNSDRRNDVLMTIADSIIDENPNEALSLIRQVRGATHFNRVLGLANRVRSESPELASQLAADLVIRVRQASPPNRIYQIAQTGRLLMNLGEQQAGQALLDEAFEAARLLGGDAREGFVRGFTAEQLAESALDDALLLIDGISETDTTSKERHLGNIAVALASIDPLRADGQRPRG